MSSQAGPPPAGALPPARLGADAFGRLAPFIQEFIWRRGWTEMRDVQVRAAAAAFDTDRHVLLAAGTASGKTEAAFLPILTQLHEDLPAGVGALYIGPLKALINDQFLRLSDLCAEADIPVTAWHGDVSASRKHALLRRPQGILQITPEALEGLLLNRSPDLMRVFGDLRWVVIDEVHAFMASDRGGQVLSLLGRLARFATDRTRLPRRVGLSATLGDYAEAVSWLDGSTGRGVEVVAEQGARTVLLLVDHFPVSAASSRTARITPPDMQDGDSSLTATGARSSGTSDPGEDAASTDALIARQPELFDAAYRATQGRKSLIFTNSRGDAESTIMALRRLAERERAPDIYHVHHGSIAPALREAAEDAMRDEGTPACTAATVTLELGIDLGQLDRVLQLGPPGSVASFLQRLGRAGRRGQRPEMFFLLREPEPVAEASVVERMPWELLQAIALIQLYAEERWLEPIARPRLPGSLLYQQTMSVVGAAGELVPAELAARVLTLAPFRAVTQDDFRALLLHLLDTDHLERTDGGGLMLGLAGEQVVRNFRFLATFQDATEWAVREEARDIGTVADAVPVGERFTLAGRTWEVVDVVAEQRLLAVRRVRGARATWFVGGPGGDLHDRVVERVRRVLTEDAVYPYLTERAGARLAEARQAARAAGLAAEPRFLSLGGGRLALLPWCGTRKLRTISLRLGGVAELKSVTERGGYLTMTTVAASGGDVVDALARVADDPWDGQAMVGPLGRQLCERAKYDPFLPEALVKRAFVADQLDIDGAAGVYRTTWTSSRDTLGGE